MKKSAYIITKPYQYANCTNIEDENIKVCILCKHFKDATRFFSIIKEKSKHFNEFILFGSKGFALIYCCFFQSKFNRIYLDSDYGLSVRILLYLFCSIDVYTYEEGYASYTYLRNPISFYDKALLKITNFLKINNWSGGSSKTKGIYLYDHDLFKKNIKLDSYHFLKKFRVPFCEKIMNLPELEYLYRGIDFSQFSDKDIVIYLSSWTISPEIHKILEKYPEKFKILKLHPHILSAPNYISEIFDYMLPADLIFEYFLLKVTTYSKSIIIIHHGSFALHYLPSFNLKNSITQEII